MSQLLNFRFRWILSQRPKNISNLIHLNLAIPSVVKQGKCFLELFIINVRL